MSPLLETRNLAVSLPGVGPVVHDMSLTVEPGEIVGIAGESGSGKTMTAQALLNLLPAGAQVSGEMWFAGRDLRALDRRDWQRVRGAELAMVFQDPSAALHPMLSVGKQLTEHMGLSKREARQRAVELLSQVRIPAPEAALRAYPHQFSGGMRQRVAIAIALARSPRLLIADEPTTALDVTVQAGILALLERLRVETGLAIVVITHDLGVLSALAARTYVCYAGRVLESGPTNELLLRPRHPYTAALLAARPEGGAVALPLAGPQGGAATALPPAQPRGPAATALQPIPGQPAAPAHAPPGCPFQPRCAFAQPECAIRPPDLAPVAPGRHSACVVHPDLTPAGAR